MQNYRSQQLVWIAHRATFDDGPKPNMIASVIRQPLEKMFAGDLDPEVLRNNIEGWVAEGKKAYRFTFVVGHFVCQVFGHNFPMGVNVDIGITNPVLFRIWPPGPTIPWPLPNSIESIGGLEALHRAFDGPLPTAPTVGS
jgi:hypothetical protein